MGKSGLQREMDSFLRETEDAGYKNHRLLAVDGSFLNLPDHPSIREEPGRRAFGRGTKKDVPKSMALLSMLYDPANYMTLDVQMDHGDGSELQLLLKQLVKAEKGDILLLDRGYPSRYLFSILESMGIHYVVRMKHNWVPVKKFMKSRSRDIIVTMEVPDGDYQRYRQQYPGMNKTIKCRLVKVRDEQGNLQILCTSLMDPAKFKLEDLANLYKLRWEIEEAIKCARPGCRWKPSVARRPPLLNRISMRRS
ncbi:MAG TPA: IS4 family transposase [Puia sp.]|jgi:hypothetical protein